MPTVSDSSAPERGAMVTWAVPGVVSNSPRIVTAYAGDVTVIVGANGAGKSALGHWLQNNSSPARTRRLIAHRQLWFESAGPNITPARRATLAQNMDSWSLQPDSRYLDHAAQQRASAVLFDLLALVNSQNSQIADLAISGADQIEIAQLAGKRVLEQLNSVLSDSGLSVQLVLTDRQTFDAVNTTKGVQYPIYQMSDGEKSAVLLAAEVLNAPSNSILIIDEPERHLHRSISSGLVEAVTAGRPDCHYVILTHDLELASSLSTQNNHSFVLSNCVWTAEAVSGWDLHAVGSSTDLPEDARTAILGGRRDVLFIEGTADSLDRKLYSLLFPHWGLSPAGSAEQVARSVTGLSSSEKHHWIRARGVVDGDGRTGDERESYLSRGILPLPVSEIESLYYLDVVVRAVAEAQAAALDRSATTLIQEARDIALAALRAAGVFERLAAKLAVSEVRRKIVDLLPTKLEPQDVPIEVIVPTPYPRILAEVQSLSASNDLDGLVRYLPVRDTALRTQVAIALGYRSFTDYESAVRVRVKADLALRSELQTVIGPIPVQI